ARVVVIGGGVVGCSVLYHLTKAGWKDVVLVERDQLTSGSTWHAAGGFHTLNGDPNVAKLQGYTIGLYDELERISGQSCGLHRTAGLLLADTLERRADGTWSVSTDKGTIHAEQVVNCGGLWAREIGRMVGLELPVLAMEHMYLVTDEMPEVVEFNRTHGHELPHAIDFKAEIYMRQERSGMLLGTYEKACVPWQPRQTPWDF